MPVNFSPTEGTGRGGASGQCSPCSQITAAAACAGESGTAISLHNHDVLPHQAPCPWEPVPGGVSTWWFALHCPAHQSSWLPMPK